MKNILSSAALLFVLCLLGCSTSTSNIANLKTQEGYAYPAQSNEEIIATSYPITGPSTEPSSLDALAVTQDVKLGLLTGTLLLNNNPLPDVPLYLGRLVTDDQGRELVAGYDRTSLLRGVTDENGKFVIMNIPEGRYGLILDIITQAYLLDTPDGSQSLLFSVTNGQTTDLGVLDYSKLSGF